MSKDYKVGKFVFREVSGKTIVKDELGNPLPVNELYNQEITKQIFVELIKKIDELEKRINVLDKRTFGSTVYGRSYYG